jgi:hypothetical protein
MTMPMAVFALISWLRHPYKENKAEVKVNNISKKEASTLIIALEVLLEIEPHSSEAKTLLARIEQCRQKQGKPKAKKNLQVN